MTQGQKKIAIIQAKNRGAATNQTMQNRGEIFENRGEFAGKNNVLADLSQMPYIR